MQNNIPIRKKYLQNEQTPFSKPVGFNIGFHDVTLSLISGTVPLVD